MTNVLLDKHGYILDGHRKNSKSLEINMVNIDDFYRAYETFRHAPNDEQRDIVEAGPTEPLFIVAGPGTGKTASLTLRILKLILVNGISPRGILATTFTKKAAAELRSRILGWGFRLVEQLSNDPSLTQEVREQLELVDINQVTTGTIDSICDDLLRRFREPGRQPPILADDFVAKTLLLREGLLSTGHYEDPDLDEFLLDLRGSKWGWNVGAKNDLAQQIWDRRFQDQVDWARFVGEGAGGNERALQVLDEVHMAYLDDLEDRGMLDFALLEQILLDRLRQGQPADWLEQLEVILVDEYQDTNLLQESIYLEMAKACDGALNVVGDDDQSLYRFRGATVELFSDFPERYRRVFGSSPRPVFLKTNYRSTNRIIGFVNDYAILDDDYQDVRVDDKPTLEPGPSASEGVPILGMFRDDADALAEDLTMFIQKVFRGPGYTLPNGAVIQRNPQGGDLGDCALLCSSPAEYSSSGRPRLPVLLRSALADQNIETFNPRGQDLTGVPVVAQFGGLLLECLDPGGDIEAQTSGLNQDMTDIFRNWRDTAIDFVETSAPAGLLEFAQGWALRDPGRDAWEWPRSAPVLDLIYGLTHYFPELHDDPEGQIYLEVFTRQVSACEQVGRFSGRVVEDPSNPGLSEASVKELLRDFLGPIAGGAIKVNEELMETFPRDRLSILSIHQAKGLEFPLLIVDVGSDFRSKHWTQAFKRFPRDGSVSHELENLLRPFTGLGAPDRSERDRAFDDLCRQFFVAYSRPEEVLLLVGLRPTFPGGSVPNIATGWERTEICHWGGDLPFIEI